MKKRYAIEVQEARDVKWGTYNGMPLMGPIKVIDRLGSEKLTVPYETLKSAKVAVLAFHAYRNGKRYSVVEIKKGVNGYERI